MDINYLSIFLGALSLMVLGALWYGPLFGQQWMKLTGISEKEMKKMPKSEMQKMYLMGFVTYLVLTFALYFLGMELGKETPQEWGKLGFLIGLFFYGFGAKPSYIWEKRPKKLWLINTLYTAVGLAIAGMVLALV